MAIGFAHQKRNKMSDKDKLERAIVALKTSNIVLKDISCNEYEAEEDCAKCSLARYLKEVLIDLGEYKDE